MKSYNLYVVSSQSIGGAGIAGATGRSVKVPNGTSNHFAAVLFVKVSTEAQRIDIQR